jgi:hypothetical protein
MIEPLQTKLVIPRSRLIGPLCAGLVTDAFLCEETEVGWPSTLGLSLEDLKDKHWMAFYGLAVSEANE